MPINIEDSEQFKSLIKALSDNLISAHIHYEMYKDLTKVLSKNPDVFAQSRTFWHLTIKAHLLTSLSLLSKVYDQNDISLHLKNWLETIRDNIELFEEENFRERLKDNPFVDSLAANPRIPDKIQLEKDIEACSNKNPLVNNLTIHRSTIIAHTSAKPVVKQIKINKNHPITYGEIEKLLKDGVEILNRYCYLFEACSHATKMIGHGDFKYIVKCVQGAVDRDHEEVEKLLKKNSKPKCKKGISLKFWKRVAATATILGIFFSGLALFYAPEALVDGSSIFSSDPMKWLILIMTSVALLVYIGIEFFEHKKQDQQST